MDQRDIDTLVQQKLGRIGRANVNQAIGYLPQILGTQETLITVASGELDRKRGLIALTNTRLIFITAGLLRQDVRSFPRQEITSVDIARGFRKQSLLVTVAGQQATIEKVYPQTVLDEIAHEIQSPSAPSSPSPAATTPDVLDQLQKLGELRDAGVLTDEEFEAKKRELLDRM